MLLFRSTLIHCIYSSMQYMKAYSISCYRKLHEDVIFDTCGAQECMLLVYMYMYIHDLIHV